MKLYYTPGACSLAPHIALREVGQTFDLEKVDLQAKTTESGENYADINSLGYVPVLRLDDDSLLTEVSAILLYIADQNPDTGLAPQSGSKERYEEYQWLTFISSEIHKGLGGLFNPHLTEDQRAAILQRVQTRFAFMEQHFAEHKWLVGEEFTVADIYAFVCLGWTKMMQIDMSSYKNIQAFLVRVGERSAVQEALATEKTTV